VLFRLLEPLIQYPLVGIALVFIFGALQAAAWFRILQKTELPPIYVIVGTLCSLGSIFMGPLTFVPLLIAALKPWPVSEPPYLKRKR